MRFLFELLLFVILVGAIFMIVATGGGALSPDYWTVMSFK